MGAPAYEWPTKTTGPSIAFTRVAIDCASEDSPRSGFGIATTVWPSLLSSRITPPNPDASANAPCTRTMVVPGASLGSSPFPVPICGSDMTTPLDIDAFVLQASRLYCLSSPQLDDVHRQVEEKTSSTGEMPAKQTHRYPKESSCQNHRWERETGSSREKHPVQPSF